MGRLKKTNPRNPLDERPYRRQTRRHIKRLASVKLFSETGPDATAERIAKGEHDPFYFYNTYLPHVFVAPPADWHGEFVTDLQRIDEMVAVTAQRNGAKSTLIFAEVLRWICYRKHKLIVYRLDSFDKASSYTQRVLVELKLNPRLRHDFGALVDADASTSDFTCYDPETKQTITRVVAFGAAMSLRGFINENTRPDVIISEDLQGRDSAESERRTTKELRRLLNDARPALVETGWKFIVAGNIICSGSLMDLLLDEQQHKAFVKRRYPAEYTDSKGARHSTWEARFPLSRLDAIRYEIGDDAYEVEFLCKAVELGTVFKEKRDIHRYATLPQQLDLITVRLMQIDPALSGFNDYTALGVFALYSHDLTRPDFGTWADVNGVPFGEGIYTIILDLFCRKVEIDKTILATYDYFFKWKVTTVHLDGSVDKAFVLERFYAHHEVLTGKRLPLVFDKFTLSKDSRIKGLQPYMQHGRILFPPEQTEDIQAVIRQFTRYGKNGEHDDAPDMVAAAVENLDPQYGTVRIRAYEV